MGRLLAQLARRVQTLDAAALESLHSILLDALEVRHA